MDNETLKQEYTKEFERTTGQKVIYIKIGNVWWHIEYEHKQFGSLTNKIRKGNLIKALSVLKTRPDFKK